MFQAVFLHQIFTLRAFATAWRAIQDDVEHKLMIGCLNKGQI